VNLNPTTELEAINEILTSIGESPVSSLKSGVADAEAAANTLLSISRRVQSSGWSFNTEVNLKLQPTISGEVILPLNTMSVDEVIGKGNSLVNRGGKLYDREKHTFILEREVTCNLTVLLTFDELPESIRSYITLKAARVFQDRTIGASDLHGYQREDEERAWHDFISVEIENSDFNVFNNSGIKANIVRRV
jgi:hypothetical protein